MNPRFQNHALNDTSHPVRARARAVRGAFLRRSLALTTFYSREIPPSAIRRFAPFSSPSLLLSRCTRRPHAPLQLIFLSRTLDFLARANHSGCYLSTQRRYIFPCRSNKSAFRSHKLLFPELLCTRDAPWPRHPRCSCSAACNCTRAPARL